MVIRNNFVKELDFLVLVKELGPIFNKRCKYALFTPFSYTCKSDKMGEGRKPIFRSKSCLIKEKIF